MASKSRSPLYAATEFAGRAALKAPLGDDYEKLNTLFQSKEERLSRIMEVLKKHKETIRDCSALYGIDPRSVAIAIAWEFSENPGGYLTDIFLPMGAQKGYGFGQMHKTTLQNLRPNLTSADSNTTRRNIETAISAVAEQIGSQREKFKTASDGIDLSDWPAGLAWLYNTSAEYVAKAGATHKDETKKALILDNEMASWGQLNLPLFAWLTAKKTIAPSSVSYIRNIKPQKGAPLSDQTPASDVSDGPTDDSSAFGPP